MLLQEDITLLDGIAYVQDACYHAEFRNSFANSVRMVPLELIAQGSGGKMADDSVASVIRPLCTMVGAATALLNVKTVVGDGTLFLFK